MERVASSLGIGFGVERTQVLGCARDDKGEGGIFMKNWLQGSQVSKARPGAPLRLFPTEISRRPSHTPTNRLDNSDSRSG